MDVTVVSFAEVLKIDVDKLMAQLKDAGINVRAPSDVVTDDDKMTLLTFLRRRNGRVEYEPGFAREDSLEDLESFCDLLLATDVSSRHSIALHAQALRVTADWLIRRLEQAGIHVSGPDQVVDRSEFERLWAWFHVQLEKAPDSEWEESEATLWTSVQDGYNTRKEEWADNRDANELWRDNNYGRDPDPD